ncbi:ScyD/ScyE family protein [Dactylosporangium sp. NPDC005555]|uniref:ScyD/ScyE family protein n=1 Tax=Dactylosporangium sp. NPDC005555 TaxID=3154889 RepID=UPI0033B30294
MNLHRKLFSTAVAALMVVLTPAAAGASAADHCDVPSRLATGLSGGSGSTIGPDGALYVTERWSGEISRVDRRTGAVTTYATGLPLPLGEPGGSMDVEFLDGKAYVLVTLVASDIGGTEVVGLYRMDGPSTFTVVADIGTWNIAHPPTSEYQVPTGAQYALQAFRGDFLVTDGHLNRVLRVTRTGGISEVVAFGNIVPTGIAVRANTVYMAEAGPAPNLPEDGKIVSFDARSPQPKQVASGGRLLVDVEFGRGTKLYALAQGFFPPGNPHGSPALPNTGQLLLTKPDGTFAVVAEGLNQPTSIEIVGNTAYVITLNGEVWTVGL